MTTTKTLTDAEVIAELMAKLKEAYAEIDRLRAKETK